MAKCGVHNLIKAIRKTACSEQRAVKGKTEAPRETKPKLQFNREIKEEETRLETRRLSSVLPALAK